MKMTRMTLIVGRQAHIIPTESSTMVQMKPGA